MNKHFKKILAGALSAIMLFSALSALAVGDSDVVASGYCGGEGDGTNLTWTLDSVGTLTISGIGKMKNFSSGSPWQEYLDKINKLVLDDGITNIGSYAFNKCTGLTGDLIIPDGVTTIGNFAFSNCSGLTGELIIPNTVTSIGDYAFNECTGLTGDLIIPNSVTNIGDGVFYDCIGFHGNLILSNNLTEIPSDAFHFCGNLTGKLIIPDKVTIIKTNAFNGCVNFTGELIIPDSVTEIYGGGFQRCKRLTSAIIGSGMTKIDAIFANCDSLISVTIPDSVTTISNSAFHYCVKLTSVTIPGSVTNIGERAFNGCVVLTDMYIQKAENSVSTGGVPSNTRIHWAYDLWECTATIADYSCTGTAIIPTEDNITVTSPKGRTLYYGTDYVIDTDSVSDNVNVGTATARIVPPEGGISILSQDVPFNIVGIDLSSATVTFPKNITWSGSAVEPEPTVVVNGKTLTKGVDYTITYSNNVFTAADFPTKDTTHTATATITGIGSYIGSLTKDFEVEGYKPDGWDSVDIRLGNLVSATIDGTFVYSGKEHTPTPKLVYHFVNPTTNVAIDYEMVEGEDFKIVSYSNNINAGEAIVTIEGIGAFENTRRITFNISPCELSATTIADIPSFEYCKKDICPDVEIKVGDTVMTNGVDYDLSYENNRNRGTATVTITGKGNLTGVTTKTFEITPRDGSKFVYIIWL